MSSIFYKSIIEDEIKTFNIKEESLKAAAKSVSKTYSKQSLTKGDTFLDYNIASNRCAYIYKYASIHTGLVTKYFGQLISKKEVKLSLQKKETLKICCLGGGPGTDVVGVFKALALSPNYHKKVVEVTVLDICGGWRNSFKRVLTNLINGKVKDVPETFVNASNFKFKLIEVDLLCNLSANIVSILSEADIVCMVKFVSAILGSSTSLSALQVIGDKLKVGAVVLFIDNVSGNVFKPVVTISQLINLQIMLGPIHQTFNNKTGHEKIRVTSKEKEVFGCLPLSGTAITVLGFMKLDKALRSILNSSGITSGNPLLDDDDDCWESDQDSEIVEILKSPLKRLMRTHQHKLTQTHITCFGDSKPQNTHATSISVLNSLVDSLCGLLNVLSQFKQQFSARNHSHHCHL